MKFHLDTIDMNSIMEIWIFQPRTQGWYSFDGTLKTLARRHGNEDVGHFAYVNLIM